MSAIQVGNQAPPFSATTQTGEQVRLADYLGKQTVVLYFYPKDGTSICTAQACSFRDAYEDFVRAGAVVIGVSGDSVERHRNFVAGRRLPFLLLSDPDKSLRKAFGVPKFLGLAPGRVTYVIDRMGVVRHIFNATFSAGGHVDEALRIVRELAPGNAGVARAKTTEAAAQANARAKTKRRWILAASAILLLASAWGENWAVQGYVNNSTVGALSDAQFKLFTRTMLLCTAGGILGLWLLSQALRGKRS